MRSALKNNFPVFKTEKDLRIAIESVCREYGAVKSLRIFSPSKEMSSGKHCALCLLELESQEAVHRLHMDDHDVFTYGNSLAFLAEVEEGFSASFR